MHLLDPELTSSSSSSATAERKDKSYDPVTERRKPAKPCVKCGKTVKMKQCKDCHKPCHPKCGILEPGTTDSLFNPLGPRVTCSKCYYKPASPIQAAKTTPQIQNALDTSNQTSTSTANVSNQSTSLNQNSSFPPLTSIDNQMINDILGNDTTFQVPRSGDQAVVDEEIANGNLSGVHLATSTPNIPLQKNRKRKLSPLSRYRQDVSKRRSARLASYLVTLHPPDDSDCSVEDARPEKKKDKQSNVELGEESEESDPDFAELPKRQINARKLNKGTQPTKTPLWEPKDLPSSDVIDLQGIEDQKLKLKTNIPEASKMTPAQYLQLFFDRDLLNFIVEQSVIYHTQKKLRCQQLTIELLARFLGFLLYAGCVPLPGKEYYWQSSTRQEQVTEHLSRNEMHAVKAQIHFANNAEQPRD